MNRTQIFGIAVLAGGVGLVGLAWHVSSGTFEQAPGAASSVALIGQYANNTMWYLLLGAAAVVGGTLLSFFGGKIWPRDS